MKDKQLSKLYDLMKGLLLTYDYGIYDDEELRNDVYELDRIISDRINKKVSKDDLRWCNEIWNKYKCDKLEDELYKMVYRKEGSVNLRRTSVIKYEPISIGYEVGDFIMKRRSFLDDDGNKDGLERTWLVETHYKNGKERNKPKMTITDETYYKNGKEIIKP